MEILDILEQKEDRAIIKYLMSTVDKQNINSICDYGCGDGRILKKIKAEKEYQDDVLKNRHPALMDVFKSAQQLSADLINRYGTTPDSLLVTTAKKMI